jgi:uncharacterized membrane protein
LKKLGADFKTETPLTEEQIQVLKELFHSVGWLVFEIELKNKFNREYKKLRNTKRKDESYERINGFLDGVEYVINLKEQYH